MTDGPFLSRFRPETGRDSWPAAGVPGDKPSRASTRSAGVLSSDGGWAGAGMGGLGRCRWPMCASVDNRQRGTL